MCTCCIPDAFKTEASQSICNDMAGTEDKISLLKRIAHRLNEAQVEWCLGASMMLYFKGIVSEFHDIDLMISVDDVEVVKTILSEMGTLCPSDQEPNPMYQTKCFMEYIIDAIDVDVMAGFAIVREGEIYDCTLCKDQITDQLMLEGEVIPMQSLRLWYRYYRLMGRSAKADMIEKAMEMTGADRRGI